MAPAGGTAVQDHVALAEIELCGDLIIAASTTDGDRLSPDRIDEVLRVREERGHEDGPPR
ncbi:conserved hypothetical protein [Streptomyces scabiei 87.22]|uniref:Uncharacterized protein n=1 Tax=Streptomyces scabiei (strain 87.22) TaxID=680198 RepID=C9ZFK2_STRSW|nr:conserved hypothetical protein [Streptomyces scabiei 87.22]